MAQSDNEDLLKFLIPFPLQVRANALWLRDFVWDLYPESNELIYDNYNSLAFGFSTADNAGNIFCSIAVYSKHINFGFNWGANIHDPFNILIGDGVQYRYIRVDDINAFPQEKMKVLLDDSYEQALAKLKKGKPVLRGQTIVKAISIKKRRPF